MTRIEELTEEPYSILERTFNEHHPSLIVGMFSGGYDSATVTHLTASWAASLGLPFKVVHINTGTGIRETLDYVRNTCQVFGWELLEYHAHENTKADGTPDPQIYDNIVLERGFPGPWMHRKMYSRLKERQIERLIREHKQSTRDCIMLASGKRSQESARRLRNTVESERMGSTLWVAPVKGWSKDDVLDYKEICNIPNNIVVDFLHRSGECNCGAYAQEGELEEIELFFPKTGCWLRELESKVRAAGFPWGWDEAPPEWWKIILDMTPERWASMTRKEQLALLKGQSNMWDALQDVGSSPLCSTCDARWASLVDG